MTEAIAATTAPGLNTFSAAAAPIRATFTAVMAPYVTGDLPAPTDVFSILMEAVAAAEPSADLVAGLCRMITEAEPSPATMAIMHRATGAALGLTGTPGRAPARPASVPRTVAAQAGVSRPGSIAERILQVLAADPANAYTVSDLAKALGGHSTGAVGAAVGMILSRGEATLASESPRRIQVVNAAPAPAPIEAATAEPEPEPTDSAEQVSDTLETAADAETPDTTEEAEAPVSSNRRKATRA